ncbi:SMR family transporter [Patulibacter sp. NPDC049589]|uniref:DMT family transporter n=1 Tax=Patulibacter sp. NPDC049589 TaxID=3154731 RepID=UPI00343201D3
MSWLFLGIAVVFEIAVAFSASKAEGFTDRRWTAATLVAGAIATLFLSQALLTFDVGVGYALWTSAAGVGIVVVGALALGERPSGRQLLGIGIVVAGVVGLQLSGAA